MLFKYETDNYTIENELRMKKNRLSFLWVLFCFCADISAVELDAKLEWSGKQQYGFEVNGVVERVSVDSGQKIKKGSVLSSLNSQPFKYAVKKCQAAVNKFDSMIFDAKLELDQAEELFERTVLSEVELQKIDGQYKRLIEQQNEAKADCLLTEWDMKQSVLKARESVYVLSSNIMKGMVISDENKSAVYIETVSSKKASAIALLDYTQKKQFSISQELKVVIDLQEFPAKIKSIDMRPDKDNKYKVIAEFYYTKLVEPGKLIKIKF